MLAHLGRERNADAVKDSLITTVNALPHVLRRTLTWDQGAAWIPAVVATLESWDGYARQEIYG